MTDNTYNGWTNRETWLINLWLGDSFEPNINADDIIALVDELFEQANIPKMWQDFIDLAVINYDELEEHYADESEVAA